MIVEKVFPAYAGMIPGSEATKTRQHRVPRIRGDDPKEYLGDDVYGRCSPHTRG